MQYVTPDEVLEYIQDHAGMWLIEDPDTGEEYWDEDACVDELHNTFHDRVSTEDVRSYLGIGSKPLTEDDWYDFWGQLAAGYADSYM